LKKVISDEYFREARKTNQDADWLKARTMAWALTYFLVESDRLDQWMNYCSEIASLPRDMEFDEEILTGVFARAFNMADPLNPNQPKADAMKRLAHDWYRYMADTQLENEQAEKEAREALDAKRDKARGKKTAPAKEKEKNKDESK
jgi:hypothetical protein